ncbi:hypothetical protein CALCODRAFT_480271 [Calocera cornea HHB12733]|uniref:Uncharacterized protein n=1 Tax=Calocera cornea HHB12733 TaxID=1353952 RepID=A0A165IQI0_9BASI|nr:hypothetical protein CALCODRAFT_480271 [Calocera cornea HHB12733]
MREAKGYGATKLSSGYFTDIQDTLRASYLRLFAQGQQKAIMLLKSALKNTEPDDMKCEDQPAPATLTAEVLEVYGVLYDHEFSQHTTITEAAFKQHMFILKQIIMSLAFDGESAVVLHWPEYFESIPESLFALASSLYLKALDCLRDAKLSSCTSVVEKRNVPHVIKIPWRGLAKTAFNWRASHGRSLHGTLPSMAQAIGCITTD